jgi:hypothetical protein
VLITLDPFITYHESNDQTYIPVQNSATAGEKLSGGLKMSSLIEFLKKQKEADQNAEVTRERKLQEWLDILNRLFSQLQQWLSEAEKQGYITVTKSETEIKEDSLGTYKAPVLTLATDRNSLRVMPIGRTIIGANGRVDIESKVGTYMLLYRATEDIWVHSAKGDKHPAYFPELTEKLFGELLSKSLS